MASEPDGAVAVAVSAPGFFVRSVIAIEPSERTRVLTRVTVMSSAVSTTAVGREAAAGDRPEALAAATSAASREPTSAATTRWRSPVSPAIGAQAAPAALQRSHWYA